MAVPLSLFWWRRVPNFGDALSQLIVAHVSGREVVHASPKYAELFAIGSLMRVVRRNMGQLNDPILWGTGLLGPLPTDFLKEVDIVLWRGPVGAEAMGVRAKRFGDPGLLTADALGRPDNQEDKVGLVLHHSQTGDPRVTALAEREPRIEIIDVADDCVSVCRKIATCAHVVSSSLHGLIVADAYGVANTWLDPGENSFFKYYDYAASIGRPLRQPVTIDDLPTVVAKLNSGRLIYQDGIAEAQSALMSTFPSHMRLDQM